MSLSTRRYKILVISDYRAVSSSRPEAELFIRLSHQGHQIHILSYPEATYYNQRFIANGIAVIENHPKRKTSPSYIRYLRALTLEHQFDIVHAFNSQGLTNAVWALAGLTCKLIAYRGYAGQTHWYDPMMYMKYFHPRVDHIICVSKDIEDILAKNMWWARKKLSTIPKGHDPEWYRDVIPADRNTLGVSKDDIVICFLANVRPFKGLTYLLEATHQLPLELPLQFIFIGQGYDKPAIKAQLDQSPFQARFHVMGYRSDALSILAASDALVQASTHGEGLSKSVVEAMCLGIAPIITDIPGNKGLLEDGQSGWMVPAKDPSAIADAIMAMAENKTERMRRGANAKAHIEKHFHIDQTVEALLSLYQKMVSSIDN